MFFFLRLVLIFSARGSMVKWYVGGGNCLCPLPFVIFDEVDYRWQNSQGLVSLLQVLISKHCAVLISRLFIFFNFCYKLNMIVIKKYVGMSHVSSLFKVKPGLYSSRPYSVGNYKTMNSFFCRFLTAYDIQVSYTEEMYTLGSGLIMTQHKSLASIAI